MRRKSIGRFGAKAGKLVLAGALVTAFAPATALAYETVDNTSKPAIGATDELKGGVKQTASTDNSVTYMGYAHSDDGTHYQSYSLYTTLTYDANGILTNINLSSGNDTFAGAWGYKCVAKAVEPIVGYLPKGVSFTASKVDSADTNYPNEYKLQLTGAEQYKGGKNNTDTGYSIKSIDLFTATEEGTLPTKEETTTNKGKTVTKTVEAPVGTFVPAVAASNWGAAQPAVTSITAGEGDAKKTIATWDEDSTVKLAADSGINLMRVKYSIGSETNIYFYAFAAIKADGTVTIVGNAEGSNGEKYIAKALATTWEEEPTIDGTMASTNRNQWTSVMATVALQRQLATWNAANFAGKSTGEVADIDTVSGATKTAVPFDRALEQAVKDGKIKGVAEDVQITIDAIGSSEAISINKTPQDASYVELKDGQYILHNHFPTGNSEIDDGDEDDGAVSNTQDDHAVAPNTVRVYNLPSATTADVAAIAKDEDAKTSRNKNKPLASYVLSELESQKDLSNPKTGRDGTTTYDYYWDKFESDLIAVSGNKDLVITAKDAKVTHIAVTYTLGHGDITLVYDLKQMVAMQEVNKQIEALSDSSSDADVLAARNAYLSLNTDVRGLVKGVNKLNQAYAKAAKNVVASINEKSTEAEIAAARDAYDKLDASAKNSFEKETLAKLTAGEERIAAAQEADIANGTVTVASATYTGKPLTPAVTVKSKSGKTLKADTDYTVAYSNNTNAGTGKVTVTGKGDYTGTKTATFAIAKANPTVKAKAANYKVAYGKKYKKKKTTKKLTGKTKVAFTTTSGGKATIAAVAKKGKVSIAKNGKITVAKGCRAGTYTLNVKVNVAAAGNYNKLANQVVKVKVKVAKK